MHHFQMPALQRAARKRRKKRELGAEGRGKGRNNGNGRRNHALTGHVSNRHGGFETLRCEGW
jgi:hypothetical protein